MNAHVIRQRGPNRLSISNRVVEPANNAPAGCHGPRNIVVRASMLQLRGVVNIGKLRLMDKEKAKGLPGCLRAGRQTPAVCGRDVYQLRIAGAT
jgi:hypothetical protein